MAVPRPLAIQIPMHVKDRDLNWRLASDSLANLDSRDVCCLVYELLCRREMRQGHFQVLSHHKNLFAAAATLLRKIGLVIS